MITTSKSSILIVDIDSDDNDSILILEKIKKSK
jgi:hypothetical protein